jgi:hypothetical protein
LKDTKEGTNRLADFVHLAAILGVDSFETGNHLVNLVDAPRELLLLGFQNANQVADFVQRAFTVGAVGSLRNDFLSLIRGHEGDASGRASL